MGNYIPMSAPVLPAVFQAARADILPALSFLAKSIVERRNTVPILSNVLIEAAPGVVTITGTDLDIQAAFTVPANVETCGAFTVDAALIADVVKSADKAAVIGFRHDLETGRLAVCHGRARQMLPTLPRDDFPIIAREDAPAFDVPADTLAHDLARLFPFISRDEARYYLGGVEFATDYAGGLALTATDGVTLARIVRDMPAGAEALESAVMPRKAAGVLAKLLKGRPDNVAIALGSRRMVAAVDGFAVVSKLIDGAFPSVAHVLDKLHGLQRVAFPDLEPDLPPVTVETFRKALRAAPDVDSGDGVFRLTVASAPEFVGVISAGESKRSSFEYGAGGGEALPYLCDLANRRGLDVDALHREALAWHEADGGETAPPQSARLVTRRGLVLGATFGRVIHPDAKAGDVIGYRPATPAEIDAQCEEMGEGVRGIVERRGMPVQADRDLPAAYVEGAFCVVMPRERPEAVCSAVSFTATDGISYPLRSKHNGAIELSAEAVRRLCGDVDPATFRPIPRTQFYRNGEALAPGWHLRGSKPKIDKARALTMSAAEMREYAEACAPVFVGVPDAPAVETPAAPIAAVEPESAPLEPVSAPEPVASAPAAPDALEARVAALEAMVARLTRPAGRVRSEAERRAILRAWRMRGELRDAKRETRMAQAATRENIATARSERERADLATATAHLWNLAADCADRRAGRMARAAIRHRTSARRLGDDLRGAQAEARALTRRLSEAGRSSIRARFAVPDAITTTDSGADAALAH